MNDKRRKEIRAYHLRIAKFAWFDTALFLTIGFALCATAENMFCYLLGLVFVWLSWWAYRIEKRRVCWLHIGLPDRDKKLKKERDVRIAAMTSEEKKQWRANLLKPIDWKKRNASGKIPRDWKIPKGI